MGRICDEADEQVGVFSSWERKFWIWKCLQVVPDDGVRFSGFFIALKGQGSCRYSYAPAMSGLEQFSFASNCPQE